MNLDLDPTILIIDAETTGLDTTNDQIVELAVQYGLEEHAPQMVWRFKPSIPMPAEAAAVHGLTDEILANEPEFKANAQRIALLLESAQVIIGYNVDFDLSMLQTEMSRACVVMPDLSSKCIVDPLQLWRQMEPRTLTDAHHRFVGEYFDGAHTAAADVIATRNVLLGMLETYGLSGQSFSVIAEKCNPERKFWLGPTKHFQWQDDVVVIAFGKHAGAVITTQPGYLQWMLKQQFPPHVAEICKAALRLKDSVSFCDWAASKYPPPSAKV